MTENIFNHITERYCTQESRRAKGLLIKISGHVKKFAVTLFLHKKNISFNALGVFNRAVASMKQDEAVASS